VGEVSFEAGQTLLHLAHDGGVEAESEVEHESRRFLSVDGNAESDPLSALAVKANRIAEGNTTFQTDPNQWGEWIADIERPAEQYRARPWHPFRVPSPASTTTTSTSRPAARVRGGCAPVSTARRGAPPAPAIDRCTRASPTTQPDSRAGRRARRRTLPVDQVPILAVDWGRTRGRSVWRLTRFGDTDEVGVAPPRLAWRIAPTSARIS
jgi:hypothetical protein